ncbi:MAG: hypothetical protein QG646_1443, partial [Euryarchaeota archaeon]|nr:hypothetical protein [Euryarchaeota archaeon]
SKKKGVYGRNRSWSDAHAFDWEKVNKKGSKK